MSAPYSITDCRRFFAEPATPRQRQYEALRAFYLEGLTSAQAAERFGYSPGAFRVLCHAFRRGALPEFFATTRPGPRDQPKKSAAQEQIVALRKRNYSIYDISRALKQQGTPLSATAVREVPAAHALRASLALKLWAIERKSHVMALVADEGLALFCGLNAMPKRSFLAEYSSQITPQKVSRLTGLWHEQLTGEALLAGQSLNLDFHSVPYFGEHPVVESHYLAKRSRRQPSILAFLAQDADSQVFCSKLTTYHGLDRLDQAGITFLTLRRRSPKLLAEVDQLPPSAWRTITLDVPNRKYRTPRIYEQKVRPKERSFRQFFITDLGHEEPTILLTNDMKSKAATIIARYAKRMLIENALSDAVRFFHIDALSSSVGFKVDFDMTLLVLASCLYRLMARRMRGYDDAQARRIFRDLIDMPADVAIT